MLDKRENYLDFFLTIKICWLKLNIFKMKL